jgi:hypothetical protein
VIASLVLEPLPRGELTRRDEEIAAHHFRHSCFQTDVRFRRYLSGLALRYGNGVADLVYGAPVC